VLVGEGNDNARRFAHEGLALRVVRQESERLTGLEIGKDEGRAKRLLQEPFSNAGTVPFQPG